MTAVGAWRRVLVGALVVGAAGGPVLVALGAGPAAAEVDGLEISATLDGRDISDADANDPLRLDPGEEPVLELVVTNGSNEDVFIRSIRLESQVVGLTFFSFTTRIDLAVEAGEEGDRQFALDLGDLDEQATGLLPAELSLLGEDREVLASESVPVDVRGSLTSVYGVFGIVVAIITALLLVGALVRLATGRLPTNRWSRGARFAVAGVGVGLTLTFFLSVLRVLLPSAGLWLGFIIGGGLVGLVVGYLTPDPRDDEDDDDLDLEVARAERDADRELRRDLDLADEDDADATVRLDVGRAAGTTLPGGPPSSGP